MNPIDDRDAIAQKALPVSRQLAHDSNVCRRNETRTNQPVRQQVRQPLSVAHIRFAAGHCLDMERTGEHDLNGPFKHVEYAFQYTLVDSSASPVIGGARPAAGARVRLPFFP